ncbi:uncharacterized protein LOC106133414 isoform X1 [Amyelois transitella]|uniref:uncharacterized protein LOC106133414 isoform X1 n=1 Tax=Amyelois transitella TaxID=680683 RepID=UPI00298FE85B|nr:uncharacterized protein LOC106133414 isoform X1 [Amyelois transitella]
MAEDEDGVSNKKSPENSNNAGPSQDNEQNTTKPDLGIEEAKYNSNENGDTSPTETQSSSKSTGATRKEENPFSFRHFLKRDLSLPGNSTYENTGARPKVYANTVQHSPTKVEVHSESRREKSRPDTQAKEKSDAGHRISDIDRFSVVDNSESKHNFYSDSSDSFYHRPNLASEPLGMPSLPDFVQDHILVEQAYLNSNGPISVDLDNLPDFTFNTSFNAGSSSSLGRRNNSNRSYDYESYMGAASSSNESGPSRVVPLDLPAGAEAAGSLPLDLPPHLSLDLTESVNPADRRNNSPRNTFPLDLPPNAGAESMRLPDFLPVHPGRTSPEPEHQDEQMRQICEELERTRAELFSERSRRSRLERELIAARDDAAAARMQAETANRAAAETRRSEARSFAQQLDAAASRVESNLSDTANRATDAEATVVKLKNQIKKLKEELSSSQEEVRALRSSQRCAAARLRHAAGVADTSLRDLLAGLEQLRGLSDSLEQT